MVADTVTPNEADYELWSVEPAVRYSMHLQLDRLERSARKALSTGYQEFVWSLRLTDNGSLVIQRLA